MAQLVDSIWELAGRIGSSGWTILVLWVIVFVYFWWFFARTRYATRTFDERVEGFRPSEVERILGEFSDADRAAYRSSASTADMFYPLLYSITAAATIVWAAPQLRFRWLVLLPFAMAIFDWLENISVITLLGRYKKQPFGSWPVVLVIAQRLKFLFFGATLVVLVITLGGWVWRKFK